MFLYYLIFLTLSCLFYDETNDTVEGGGVFFSKGGVGGGVRERG